MSFKEWGVPLPDGFHILVERINKRGKITGFTVVLIYDGECVSRYDTAHNAAHRDILGKTQGLIAKEWHETLPLNEVLTNAIKDFKQNYGSYYAFYISN